MKGSRFQKIWNDLSDTRKDRIEARFQALKQEYEALQDLRKDLALTQTDVAEAMQTRQVNISKLEQRQDIKLSTLRDYLASLGGTMKIMVEFPGHPPVFLAGLTEGRDRAQIE